MKTNIKDTARKIARMSSSDLSELEAVLIQHNIVATIYRAGGSMFEESNIGDSYCKVVLEWVPKNKKLQVVKAVKELLGIGLKEAKRLTDYPPSVLKEYSTLTDGKRIQTELEDIGCDVEIEELS